MMDMLKEYVQISLCMEYVYQPQAITLILTIPMLCRPLLLPLVSHCALLLVHSGWHATRVSPIPPVSCDLSSMYRVFIYDINLLTLTRTCQ